MDRKTVAEIVYAKYEKHYPGIEDMVDVIMQLLTTHRQETYRHILEHGLNDTFTHIEWIEFLERGAGGIEANRE